MTENSEKSGQSVPMDIDKRSKPRKLTEESSKSVEAMSATYDVVVELLNDAAVMHKGADKIVNLRKVQELIIYKSPNLLDNFMDEMLAFQSDSSKDVKKFIIAFMEEACKKDHECLSKVLPSMMMLLSDDDVSVQKKVVLTVNSMFKVTLMWISKAKKTRPEMTIVWEHLMELQKLLFEMLESVNDGIRTHVVKFLEGLTLILSRRTSESEVPKNQDKEFSLEQMPETNGVVDVSKLKEDGNKAFISLLQFQSSPHISSINLMTVMNALSNIGKQRPQYFDQIVQSFEALHVNLPPTLAKSQVSSVRKNLKNQLLSLLKHPSSVELTHQITTLLTDLGASQSEIAKSMPKDVEIRKRKAAIETSNANNFSSAKKSKIIEVDDDDDGTTPWVDRSKKSKPDPTQKHTAIDITAEDILPRLTVQNVSDLVLLSMVMLPETMPAQFQNTYTPIAAAGTKHQISHIARLLATQLTMAGLGKGLGELQMQTKKEAAVEETDEQPSSSKQIIQTVVGLKTDEPESKMTKLPLPQIPVPSARKIKQFQLSSITKPIKKSGMDAMLFQAMNRLIEAERVATSSHKELHRTKILALLTTLTGDALSNALSEYIFNDIRTHQDLAFAWLYQEYAHNHGYSANHLKGSSMTHTRYDDCFKHLFVRSMLNGDHHSENFFHRLIQEAPLLSDHSLGMIRRYCAEPARTSSGMVLLTQLINNRPAHRLKFLELMLSFTANEDPEIRTVSINAAKSLHMSGLMQDAIEKYASCQLKYLLLPKPPADSEASWSEESIKAHLYLHLELLPANHKLIHELANIYTATSADIKRTILRVLEVPVRGMGMDSPELLTLVENCPKGSETLVMRVIHILTDKAKPSPELVDRIRDLYQKRVPDVRFLIPVLNGLSKNEVIEALPKLIKLNPHVVKEVFNRLMGSHVANDSVYHSPLTPVELLVALHKIDPATSKCDMKTIIKAANMCFSERNIYTQETVAIVMQKLMEIDPLPTLLMRTVIQSLSMYPRLVGFVLNVLQRLIVKKVWKQKKVWEGFIRCCQRAKPQSFQVLLTLPAAQLKEVFDLCPDLREPLVEHVQAFTEHQKSHVNRSVIEFLEQGNAGEANVDENTKNEAELVISTDSQETHIGQESSGEKGQNIESLSDVTAQKIGNLSDTPASRLGNVTGSSPQKIENVSVHKISAISSVVKPLASSGSPIPGDGKESVSSPSSNSKRDVEKSIKEDNFENEDEDDERDLGKGSSRKRYSPQSRKSRRDSPEERTTDSKSKSKSSLRSSTKASSQSQRSSSSKKK